MQIPHTHCLSRPRALASFALCTYFSSLYTRRIKCNYRRAKCLLHFSCRTEYSRCSAADRVVTIPINNIWECKRRRTYATRHHKESPSVSASLSLWSRARNQLCNGSREDIRCMQIEAISAAHLFLLYLKEKPTARTHIPLRSMQLSLTLVKAPCRCVVLGTSAQLTSKIARLDQLVIGPIYFFSGIKEW